MKKVFPGRFAEEIWPARPRPPWKRSTMEKLRLGPCTGMNYTRIKNIYKLIVFDFHFRYLQKQHNVDVGKEAKLPRFYTSIDEVDISVEVTFIQRLVNSKLF